MKKQLLIALTVLSLASVLQAECFGNEKDGFTALAFGTAKIGDESSSSVSFYSKRFTKIADNFGLGYIIGVSGIGDAGKDDKGKAVGYREVSLGGSLKYDLTQRISLYGDLTYNYGGLTGGYATGKGLGTTLGTLYKFGDHKKNFFVGVEYKKSTIEMEPIRGKNFDVDITRTELSLGWSF